MKQPLVELHFWGVTATVVHMAAKRTAARRVVGYVRISRDRENETSTDSQQAAIQAWCTAHGHQLVKVVVEPGRSAFKSSRASRPGYREAAQLVRSGAADMLAVWKVDRACRNTLDLLQLVQDLESHGAEFASVTEQFDTSTPMGRAMMTIVGVLAELESAQKSERAIEWHRHRRTTGAVPPGRAALGYRKPEPNKLEPDPVVAPLVRAAAEAVAAGASLRSQTIALNEAGVEITHTGFKTALRSPTLVGLVPTSVLPRRAGARIIDGADLVPGGWEPILDRETWDQLRRILDAPEHRTTYGNRLRWPLVAIARCHCGSRMRHHLDKYRVKSGTRQLGRLLCLDQDCLNGIGHDAVEEAVTAAVLDLLDNDQWNAVRSKVPEGEAESAEEIEAKLSRMWSMVLDGSIEPEEYAEAKARWAGEVVAAESDPIDLPDVDDLRSAWPDLTPSEKLLVYRATIVSLVIGPAKRKGGRGVDLSRVQLELVA